MKARLTAAPSKPTLIRRRSLIRAIAALPVLTAARLVLAEGDQGSAVAEDVLSTVSRRYATLGSYSDTGIVMIEYQLPATPLTTERHRFETRFRAPRNFFFRFDEDPSSGSDALVIWCDGGSFQSWWKATGVHDIYDGGRGATAFLTAQSPTDDAANLIAPHLFPQAELYGPTTQLIAPQDLGGAYLDGGPAQMYSANERADGTQTKSARPTTLWVDARSGLFVKVEIEADKGSAPGTIDRKVFEIMPVANPELNDEQFVFTPQGR